MPLTSEDPMMRLLIVSEYIDENQNSTGYFWSKIINRLRRSSENISVLAPSRFTKYESFENKPSIARRLFKQISVSLSLAWRMAASADKNSVVFTGTNPAILLALTPILKRLFKFKWVLLVHDVFPENMVAAGLIRENNALFKLISRYFSWTYSSPDLLICIGRDMQELLQAKTHGRAETAFVPNWANGEEVYPTRREEVPFFSEHAWHKHVVFQFFGNIGRVQGLENLLSGIALSKAKNAAFLFIGGGASVPDLEKFIKKNPDKNIKYIGPLPLQEKNKGLAMCDVALVTLERGMLGLGVPSKAYFSLAAGKPILAVVEDESEIARMIDEHPIGWHCSPDSPEGLAKLIDDICESPDQLLEKKPRSVFLSNYSEEIVLERFAEIIGAFTHCENKRNSTSKSA